MADGTAIEWTDASWNPVRARDPKTLKVGWHCEHVTTGCEFCYAEGINKRLGTGLPFKPGHRKDLQIFVDEATLLAPLRWKRPRKIFVGSMTDLFADFVTDDMLDRIFAVMALCPQHTFQVLTKRAERMRAWFARERSRTAPAECLAELYVENPEIAGKWPLDADRAIGVGTRGWPLPNVWLGVSAERQEEADERIPHLLATPAAVRFVSAEPLLGPIDFVTGGEVTEVGHINWLRGFRGSDPPIPRLDWIIVGGESGPKARPMHPSWVRDIHQQCQAAGVSFFFKQWGEFAPAANHRPVPEERMRWVADDGRYIAGHRLREVERDDERGIGNWKLIARVGKKAAGRLLDGREWNEFPEVRT